MYRLLIMTILCLAFAGCASPPASSDVAARPAGERGEDFAALLRSGMSWDFEPTKDPADAAARSDLVVVGTITDVVAGRTLPYGRSNDQANLVVAVEKVVKGNAATGDTVYVEVPKPTDVAIEKLRATTPDGRVALFLDDRTEVKANGAEAGRPSGTPIYAPLIDGFVIETRAGWTSGRVSRDEVLAGWTALPTFDEVVAAAR